MSARTCRPVIAVLEGIDWDIGTTRMPRMPIGITHLVGVPRMG